MLTKDFELKISLISRDLRNHLGLILLIGGDIIIYIINKIVHTNKFYFTNESD